MIFNQSSQILSVRVCVPRINLPEVIHLGIWGGRSYNLVPCTHLKYPQSSNLRQTINVQLPRLKTVVHHRKVC